ncbi:Bug family tripartite tricarboxylate transporter substrate binding protein [Sediminicoccus rosea]|uniref:Tripartite tricarboxylate transporter substrate binding protein n=1 Tax=Sediminicoccus rosea TaxID=1225128 RepID=A0ABZ0PGR0_9PROT|nr:tripartite tricarboxylate transporter substrate binding protein [Sediminicoccus rosea]WPB84656.1 tripartite tricarboxylate transporter substrate binding protein [Sediminicoccus rosea]
MRRTILKGLATLATLGSLAAPALAQAPFPERPIRLIIPYAPGGGTDATMRVLTGPMGEILGQPFVIENRTAGAGTIGAAMVAQARPDGYTLLADPSAHALNHMLIRNLPFNYERDFAPIARMSVMPLIMIVPANERAADLATYIARLREQGGRVSWASAGIGTASHLSGFLFVQRAGIESTHVPYRGGSQGAQAVLAGDTMFNFATAPSAVGLVQGRQLRALAVSSATRMSVLPDVPTVAEAALPGFELVEWIGLWAPTGTPPAILDRIQDAAQRTLAMPDIRARLATLGMEAAFQPRPEFTRFLTEQRALLTRIATDAGLRPE